MTYAPILLDALDTVRDYILSLYKVNKKSKRDRWNHTHLVQSLEVVLSLAYKQYNNQKINGD